MTVSAVSAPGGGSAAGGSSTRGSAGMSRRALGEFSSFDLFDVDIDGVRSEIARCVDGSDAQFFSARDLEESDRQRNW